MRYIVILESPLLLHQLQEITGAAKEVIYLLNEPVHLKKPVPKQIKRLREDPFKLDTYKKLSLNQDDRIIIHVSTSGTTEKLLSSILKVCDSVPTVVLRNNPTGSSVLHRENISYLPLNELLEKNITNEWTNISNRKKTSTIRTLTKDAENILLLIQHDPDPDALASALGLRTLLGRNRVTAPMGSFGKVTRSENLNMMRLLDIRYTIVDSQSLNNYAMVAMLDVQPPYFGPSMPRADIIFDHHPPSDSYQCAFRDIRMTYGATSTILCEYLTANKLKLTQRLATALLYGIKTDTLMLGRNVNPADIEAFTTLYPLANHNLVRRMENPSLNPEEVSSFIKALKKQIILNKILFVHLGRVKQEDIIPRLADFCLQIEGADWSVVSGLFQRNLVISVRNVGYVKSAGDIVTKIFNDRKVAGGHRTMAKAVMPTKDFMQSFGITTTKDIEEKVVDLFVKGLKKYAS
jgi:nanoRNase/pAp phosphatase (c-di-AMP/oligoRNAs hydrolase)